MEAFLDILTLQYLELVVDFLLCLGVLGFESLSCCIADSH
jgi:hypothetical protein